VSLGVASERVRVLRNGVDLAMFHPVDRVAARQALGLTRPTLLTVGNLVALKRHRLMVEALVSLTQADLVIVGEGSERAAIEALARQRGSPTASVFSGTCRSTAFPLSIARPISLCWFRPRKVGPMCCWRAWHAGRRHLSPTSTELPISSPRPRRVASCVRPRRIDSPPRPATCSRHLPPGPPPGPTPSASTGRARRKGRSCCFTRSADRRPAVNPRRLPVSAARATVYFGVARHAVRPRALAVDELDRLRPDARPAGPIGERRHHAPRQQLRLVRGEEIACLPITDQFTMTADARGDDDALLGHGLERLEGRHQLGEPNRNAREDE